MAHSKKQGITIGNGSIKTPILADEKDLTADELRPSQSSTSIESASIKPESLPEALSLLQTLCFDLRSLHCEVAILARGKRIYIIVSTAPDIGALAITDGGHITIDGVPVSLFASIESDAIK